jgi:hypothetical protein
MNMRKFAVLGGLAAGAALAFAPLATADPVAITNTVDSEISALNGQFDLDALLAGDSSDVTAPTAGDPFATITPTDITDVQGTGTTATPFDYLVYGVNPENAGLSPDPGSYDVLNGAEIRFDEAYNIADYALLNNGALDPNSADIFGAAIPVADTTAAEAIASFYNDGIGDLSGFFDTNLGALDITAAQAGDLLSLLGSL